MIMNKKLISQIKNEWHSNLWLIVELFFVSVILWFVVDYVYTTMNTYHQPIGFDLTHCYNIIYSQLDPSNPNYDPNDTLPENDFKEIISRLRQRSDIEAIGISSASVPYSTSYIGEEVKYDTISRNVRMRKADSGFIRVFRIKGAQGESTEQLVRQFDKTPDGFIVASDFLGPNHPIKLESLIGKRFYFGDSTKVDRLAAIVGRLRNNDYELLGNTSSVIKHLENGVGDDISIRVKASQDNDFKNRFWIYANRNLRVGNVYVSDIQSYQDMRRTVNHPYDIIVRDFMIGAAFLLLNIFLGLLGTFWFRTQRRKSEIALFKALGATNGSVFARQMTEGLLLLTLATIPAILIDLNLAYVGLNTSVDGVTLAPGRFIAAVAITYLLIALMIFFGNLMPARKAMKVQPAEALHEE